MLQLARQETNVPYTTDKQHAESDRREHRRNVIAGWALFAIAAIIAYCVTR